MDITLVIPAYNEEKYIGACLDSVQKYAAGKFKEVIVVDNASTDRTAEIAMRYPQVRIVREPRKGLTYARQAGFLAASSEYLAYIDADCRLTPEWFERAEGAFRKHPDAVSFSGSVTYYDGPRLARVAIVSAEWVALPFVYFFFRMITIGGNFIARRDAIEGIGGFDTSIAFYGEDSDLSRRLARMGREYFSMHFKVETSMRRFIYDGYMDTIAIYVANALSHLFLQRSVTSAYTDRR